MISTHVLNFIDQADDIFLFHNLENINSVYHYSVPNAKLAYPEPFIASASFMHSDLWFVHILVYQYWLWFLFSFIIVFFFLTFLCTVRWCNMRIRPRRETRGVSRSKCGDLITACVPVSWATSIIVNESTDAIDYYDGFGTTELVVGIRAYQWGWEYYYPKDLDLNYNLKPNYSAFIGNSLKYNKTTDTNLSSNNLWRFYQNKAFDHVVTPAHLLVIPLDNYKLINFMNFNDIGANTIYESNAFKKIKMFSKTYTSDLTFLPNNFSNKYKVFSNLYINDNSYTDSYLYGLKRQHNFLSSSSIFNNQATFMNLNSINKLIAFNFNNSQSNSTKINNFNSLLFFKKHSNSGITNTTFLLNDFLNKKFSYLENTNFKNFTSFSNYLNLINDDTDKKKIVNPIYKFFNKKYLKKNNINNFYDLNKLNSYSDISLLNNGELNYFLNNVNKTTKNFSSFSNNQSVSLTNRNIRNFINVSPNFSSLNHSPFLNKINNYIFNNNNNLNFNNFFFFNNSESNWVDLNTTNKIGSNRISYDYPYSPIASNNAMVNSLNHDSHKFTYLPDTPIVLQGKEELMPTFLTNIYWNFYWANSSFNWRTDNLFNYGSAHTNFYLPTFNFYYDYDFRNWQSFELLEDSFWESIYSIYNYDEYLVLTKDFYDYEYFDKIANYYNNLNKLVHFKDKILYKPFFNDNLINEDSLSYVYLDDFVSPSNLLLSKDFFIFPTIVSYFNIEENFESFKNLEYLYNLNNKIILNSVNSRNNPYSYIAVLDAFRSDFDEFSWFMDDSNAVNFNFFDKQKYSQKILYFSKLHPEILESIDMDNLNILLDISNDKVSRFSNNVNLRNTARNSIVTYNAMQKVFRTRFDENRSHTKLNDFSSFFIKQPFISSERTAYENLLGKNKNSFYKNSFYKNSFKSIFNDLSAVSASLNFYFYDFPFLLAFKSDSSRYLWFDWFAKWGFYEVQPSSSSRYAIFGMPYFSKNFEFSPINGEVLNETENYLTRISRARRNYLPNWTYSPYFYAKNTNWYKNNVLFDVINDSKNSIASTFYLLGDMDWYWDSVHYLNFNNNQFFPSNSNVNSYSRSSWKPQASIQSYYYHVSTLIDILTKREFLYRELFFSSNKLINLPYYLTSNPKNPLVSELKASFNFINPLSNLTEYSRESYYYSLNFFNFILLKAFISNHLNFLNLSILNDYIFYYFFSTDSYDSKNTNNELYKNQYRPMRKGITNMIRLHATGAMALPIEIRLQILASSKDVIHSWAIPSAGIKIDCVPGYSSHRVMIFLVSGIFWGQCMEVCGRYHHWMPIIVYFMKRDLFFLWCTHFIFLSGSNNMWNINDRQYADYIRLASFDKNTWLSELNL